MTIAIAEIFASSVANRAAVGVGATAVRRLPTNGKIVGQQKMILPAIPLAHTTTSMGLRTNAIMQLKRQRCNSCTATLQPFHQRTALHRPNGMLTALTSSTSKSRGGSMIRLRTAVRQQQQQTMQKRHYEASSTSRSKSFRNPTRTSHPLFRLLCQSLSHTLLKPRSLPLPRYISPQHFSFTWSEIFGHSSFMLVAASYITQDFLELRILAVVGSTSMLFFTYFHPHGRVLWLPLKWNVLFIAINSYRIGKVFFDRYMADQMSEELKLFREEHLSVLDEVDYCRLIKMAKEEVFEEGDLVLYQGQSNPFIRIVIEGELEVLRDGTLTYILEEGNFVSEAGLHSGLMLRGSIESCGTIVVGPPFDPTGQNNAQSNKKNHVRCLKWDRAELMDLLESDPRLFVALKAALSWDIVKKLKIARHMLAEGRVKDPKSWAMKREDQGISRYAAILQNMLYHPEDFANISDILTKYRRIHRIDDKDHQKALAKLGWTEEEFRLGSKKIVEESDELEDEEYDSARWRGVKSYSSKLVRSITALGNVGSRRNEHSPPKC